MIVPTLFSASVTSAAEAIVSSEAKIASPIAVPVPGSRREMTRRIASRLSVAEMICCAVLSKATTPINVSAGALSTNRIADFFATSMRDGATSVALIDNDTSMASATTAFSVLSVSS
jgi:hypothetical protein